jgi:hypothetical protein
VDVGVAVGVAVGVGGGVKAGDRVGDGSDVEGRTDGGGALNESVGADGGEAVGLDGALPLGVGRGTGLSVGEADGDGLAVKEELVGAVAVGGAGLRVAAWLGLDALEGLGELTPVNGDEVGLASGDLPRPRKTAPRIASRTARAAPPAMVSVLVRSAGSGGGGDG